MEKNITIHFHHKKKKSKEKKYLSFGQVVIDILGSEYCKFTYNIKGFFLLEPISKAEYEKNNGLGLHIHHVNKSFNKIDSFTIYDIVKRSLGIKKADFAVNCKIFDKAIVFDFPLDENLMLEFYMKSLGLGAYHNEFVQD